MRSRYYLLGIFSLALCSVQAQRGFSLKDVPAKKKVEVRYDGKLFTAYCYFDSTEKPVLFPIKTLSGIAITRGFPIAPRAGERVDHPHHVGLWFNYENVNGLDFWNNSTAIAPERKHLYGSIRHQKILSSQAEPDKAELVTLSHWVDPGGKVLVEETTRFVFTRQGTALIIDRGCTLKAVVDEVLFKDVKDGMLGLRVTREMEMPSTQEDKFVDAHGNITAVKKLDNANVTGMYVNREGIKGDDAWSKRSRWTCLNGKKDGESISIAMIDHPGNPGYPTYWHVRGYGLFAANPLGQKVFSGGKEELNFKLLKDQSADFKYRVIIQEGNILSAPDLDRFADEFARR